MTHLPSKRTALVIVVCAATMLSLSMGLRQSLGIFMLPLTRDVAISVSDFTFAVAVQNLLWGFFQPLTGALTARFGFGPIMFVGAALYAFGLYLLSEATGFWSVFFGAGVLIGVAMACVGPAIGLAISSFVVSDAQRSFTLGAVSAAGSIGALIAAPIGQSLATDFGWRTGVFGFFIMAAILLPAAWFASGVDKVARPAGPVKEAASARDALALAFRNPGFIVMACAYFVCGMQLVFLTTHLPTYLAICGMDPMLSAQALGVIGGFNILGSLFFGWAGGRWSKQALLGMIYISRSIVLGWYFMLPPTPATTLIFAALMGFLWLGVAVLMAGSVSEIFGLRWQAMLVGIAFMSHQLGSFVGAYGGGVIYDWLGSYDLAWRLGVGLGLVAGILQVMFALASPPPKLAR
jgi:predicted MFS family arabinose efflux permease